jgi:hypothetical protein
LNRGNDLLTPVWAQPDRRPELSARGWEALLGQARQSHLIARLATHHADRAWLGQVPEAPRRHLEGGLRLADRQRHEVRWEADCIARALAGLGIPVVLLKGAAYMLADLPAAKGRLFGDIDVMVPREHIARAESALMAGGWICDERDPYNQRYYREWTHEIPPLRHVERNTYLDLHHTITPPTSRFRVDGALLLRDAVPLPGHALLRVLAPVDMVLHSAVHLFQEGEFGHGLRDLLDLQDLMRHFAAQDADFWPRLVARAQALDLGIPLYHALFHLRRLFGFEPPPAWAEALGRMAPPAPARAAMAWMLGLALRPIYPGCDTRWSGLARWLLYVRSHALRMPLRLVIPHLLRKAWMRRFTAKEKNT